MPPRKQLQHPDAVKVEIKTMQLIKRLQRHALGREDQLSALQLRAIQVLLAKAIEHSGGLALTHEEALDRLDDDKQDDA
jgi:hypothetical protein